MSATAVEAASDARMKRNVWLLFFCTALMHSTMVGQAVMAVLVGYSLAEDKTLATLPVAVQMTAVMAASIPAGIIFARLGRRAGFTLGALSSITGALIFAWGIYAQDFVIYCVGAAFNGAGFGISQHYRFAAAEVASPAYRARAISLVMAGGVLSSLLGPELVKHSRELLMPHLFLGTYLFIAIMPAVCLILLAIVDLPPPPRRQKIATPLMEIVRRPAFITAAVAGMVAFGTMNLLMTSTPLEMMLCGFGVNDSATVIQAHAVAMYAPGFITGRLITRFGVRPIITVGAAMNVVCVAVGLSGETFGHFILALALLGIGWNFMFVGATTMLGTAHSPEERVKTQAANDFLVFGTVACTAFASGAVHVSAGWQILNLLLLPAIALALAMIWFQAYRTNRAAKAA